MAKAAAAAAKKVLKMAAGSEVIATAGKRRGSEVHAWRRISRCMSRSVFPISVSLTLRVSLVCAAVLPFSAFELCHVPPLPSSWIHEVLSLSHEGKDHMY
ncbi:Os03g0800900 [Oryza sativa Japonica Group]|uniref:Os03g0800900 protein n=1 Tax=Oryza sativa subsp. japonica TaxID=39947 RepID=A0A0P0W4W0_ORYSJ|nr:hypothetical protein EE612_021066 [Oryza sativa]BAS86890.1 Os03g0800900 [Oryza sativa Japonica Group]